MSKYYAVLVGRNPGIYRTWKDTQAQTNGFPKAVFKSFLTLQEAQAFMNINVENKDVEYPLPDSYVSFCDGSYKSKAKGRGVGGNGISGYGIVIVEPDGKIHEFYGQCELEHHSNNTGELTAVKGSLELVNGNLIIYTDSLYSVNASKLPLAVGAPNYDLIKQIKDLLEIRRRDYKVEIYHVYGHKGQEMNERADRLAKRGASGK